MLGARKTVKNGLFLASLARLEDATHPARPRLLQTNQRKSLTTVMRNLEDHAPATIKSPDIQLLPPALMRLGEIRPPSVLDSFKRFLDGLRWIAPGLLCPIGWFTRDSLFLSSSQSSGSD